jgi:hypothetical protein
VIREDRELLTELARLDRAMASLDLRVMDGSAGSAEQRDYGQRLIAVGERLRRRADGETSHPVVVEGTMLLGNGDSLALPGHGVEPYWNRARD